MEYGTQFASELLKEEFSTIFSQRQKLYEEKGIELEEEIVEKEKGLVLKQAVINSAQKSKAAGKALLEGLWEVYWNNYHRTLDEMDTLSEWADTHLGNFIDSHYLMDLVRTVEQVFPAVMRWELQNKPVTDANGVIIDIPYLINEIGPAKLKLINQFFSEKFVIEQTIEGQESQTTIERDTPESEPVTKEEIQRQALQAASNMKRDELSEFKEQVTGKREGRKKEIPFYIRVREDKLYDVEIAEPLTTLQLMLLKSVLGIYYREV